MHVSVSVPKWHGFCKIGFLHHTFHPLPQSTSVQRPNPRRLFMLKFSNIAVLVAALAAAAPFASATPISYTLGSYGTAGIGPYSPTVTVANTALTYVGDETYSSVALIPSSPGPLVGQAGTGFTATGVEATELNPLTVWSGPLTNSSWVGINANAGPVSTSNPAYGYYEFTTTFSAVAGNYSGFLDVEADDTTEVLL